MRTMSFACTLAAIVAFAGPATSAHAGTDAGPIVTIWETPNANGGTYTVSVDSTQSAFNWFVTAFAVTTDSETTGVNTFRSGWGADLITSTQWDSGVDYELEDFFGDLFPVFSTGSEGVGSFAQVFGGGTHVAVFWTSVYFASAIGPNNTASEWEWLDGPAASTAFALVSGGPGGEQVLACPVGLNGAGGACTPLSAIPIPAAVWLFGSGMLGLLGMARRRRAA